MASRPLRDIIDRGGATSYWHYLKRYRRPTGHIGFTLEIIQGYRKVWRWKRETLKHGECYIGPFKGEFGNFLLHCLPFISWLHANGIKVHYCGMGLHKPFMIDEQGNSLVTNFYELRDFFKEVGPKANQTDPPEDVKEAIAAWKKEADATGLPRWEIDDPFIYWHVYRNWILQKPHQKAYRLNKVYHPEKENACVIFPRKKGGRFTPNNGGPWDYSEIARRVSPYFDKVYITGHPSLSEDLEAFDNVEVHLSEDNTNTITKCSAARLIITQHSGAVHMGSYTETPVLVAFNGDPPIKGLADTIRFRRHLNAKYPLEYAFSLDEIEAFVKGL